MTNITRSLVFFSSNRERKRPVSLFILLLSLFFTLSAQAAIDTSKLEALGLAYNENPTITNGQALDAELERVLAQQGERSADNLGAIGNAQYMLGDEKIGKQNIIESANAGSGLGAYVYSLLYLEQNNTTERMRWLHEAEKRGYPFAASALGDEYASMNYDDDAIKWFQQAYETKQESNATRASAASNLGVLYSDKKAYDTAASWYQKGVELGSKSAAFNLAFMYDSQMKAYDKAIPWYEKAHQMGEENAAYNLAYVYDVKLKQYDKAAEWYKKAVDMGSSKAAFNLGVMYKNQKQYDKAVIWYKKAALMDHPDATYNLGYLYQIYLKDYDKAAFWYRKAHEMQHINATYNLGVMYRELKQYANAEIWYKKAADMGDTQALYSLAYLYETYLKDFPKAKIWYQKVADSGDPRGYWGMGNLLVKQGDAVQGAGYYYYAVKQGLPLSQLMAYLDKNLPLTNAEFKAGYEWQKTHFDDPYTGELGR